MRTKILFLSSIVCMCSMAAAVASECTGDDCYEPEPVVESVNREYSWFDYGAPDEPIVEYETVTDEVVVDAPSNMTPMRNVKLLSIKPAPIDDRAPLWDGTNGKYTPRAYPKTVSWKNGVPLWDDSISNYQKKDFRDWMLSDLPELYLREPDANDVELVELYNDTMNDAAETRARIEELLTPNKPSENLWLDTSTTEIVDVTPPCDTPTTFAPDPKYVAQDMSAPIRTAFGDDGCPFETETECNIWRRKPIIRETVSPRSPKIRADKMYELLSSANCNGELDANSPAAAPLVERYKMLMKSARACCIEGMKYSLKNAGASDGLIYKFMADDANFYNIGNRCLMMNDTELDEKYPETATAAVIADVRNGCLCRGRQWFTAMLAPFVDAWNASPDFAASKFYWTYTDGLNRAVTVSINDDVQNVLEQIAVCP